MFELILIHHDQITLDLLDEIIKVKSAAWPYNYEEQLNWMNTNLKNSSIHVILLANKNIVAYLNLIEIELIIDSNYSWGYGIGNVCALKKGKGWGKELISRVNVYLEKNDKIGLLFCKNKLINFYRDNGWFLIRKEQLIFTNIISDINIFAFNLKSDFKILTYTGELF